MKDFLVQIIEKDNSVEFSELATRLEITPAKDTDTDKEPWLRVYNGDYLLFATGASHYRITSSDDVVQLER